MLNKPDIEFIPSDGHAGNEVHHYYRQATIPTSSDPLQVGDLWSDTTAGKLKRCTSVSPITFVDVEGGQVHALTSSNHTLSGATDGQAFKATGASTFAFEDDDFGLLIVIDGGGSAITTGVKLDVELPFPGVWESWRVLADQSGSIVIDVWKDTYANFPPTVADTITASAKPTLTSASKNENTTLTGWTTTFSAGDLLRINVDSVATVTRVLLSLRGRKT